MNVQELVTVFFWGYKCWTVCEFLNLKVYTLATMCNFYQYISPHINDIMLYFSISERFSDACICWIWKPCMSPARNGVHVLFRFCWRIWRCAIYFHNSCFTLIYLHRSRSTDTRWQYSGYSRVHPGILYWSRLNPITRILYELLYCFPSLYQMFLHPPKTGLKLHHIVQLD